MVQSIIGATQKRRDGSSPVFAGVERWFWTFSEAAFLIIYCSILPVFRVSVLQESYRLGLVAPKSGPVSGQPSKQSSWPERYVQTGYSKCRFYQENNLAGVLGWSHLMSKSRWAPDVVKKVRLPSQMPLVLVVVGSLSSRNLEYLKTFDLAELDAIELTTQQIVAHVVNRGLSGSRPAIDADVLETVTEALLREYQCKLTYQARSWPEPEEVIVHPFGLIFRDPNVYLIGTIEGREGIRQLVLHRATAGELVEQPVARDEDFDLDLYIRSGAMGILKSNKPVFLRLRCDKPALNHLIESPLGFDQITSEIDDSTFEISVTVGDTQDLRWWLTAQAIHCDILEPEWLHSEIESTLEKGLKRVGRHSTE